VNCLTCDHSLGFLPSALDVSALEPVGNGNWRPLARNHSGQMHRFCDNGRQHQVCNWMVPADDAEPLCVSCRLNTVIPDLSVQGNRERWHKLEIAKRRIIYSILRFGLPMDQTDNCPKLSFKFVADVPGSAPELTGHANGLITVNIAEADDAERERRRVSLREPYRTLLGHLRHEVAHYYWDRLIANSRWLGDYRRLFGDESANYAAALRRYYEQGAPRDWQTRHVSAYATSHPWEDWAETWAHYFHIVDMVETAGWFGLKLQPIHPAARSMTADAGKVMEANLNFDCILENWFPITCALNSLNRSMGLLDAYPFVLSTSAIEKLRFIHSVVQSESSRRGQ
jgi:hypothetical protein